MEQDAYQQLREKYTAQSLHEVYKEGTLYRMRKTALRHGVESPYSFATHAALADYDKKTCTRCARPLTSIEEGERWAVDEARLYWCGQCKDQLPRLGTVQHFIDTPDDRAMPRLMRDVIQQINNHPSFLQLNHDTRQMVGWLSQEQQRKSDDNRYLREIWFFMYKGEAMPPK